MSSNFDINNSRENTENLSEIDTDIYDALFAPPPENESIADRIERMRAQKVIEQMQNNTVHTVNSGLPRKIFNFSPDIHKISPFKVFIILVLAMILSVAVFLVVALNKIESGEVNLSGFEQMINQDAQQEFSE